MSETLERHEFGAEVGRLLDLVVHALYYDREIFLRELVADAVDRHRFEALTDQFLTLPAEAKVRILPDKAARTLTISDPGIGMSKAELAQHRGTALLSLLKEEVSEVRSTDRLVDSAVVLVAPQYGPDLQMQRMLRRAGRSVGGSLPVLEINPRHPLIRRLADPRVSQEELVETAGVLLDLARIQDGDSPRDPADFARRVTAALASDPD